MSSEWGQRWNRARYETGRASIYRLTGCEGHVSACYAAAPFRTLLDDQGEAVIAGAIGAPCHLEYERLRDWTPDDIDSLILWNPRTGGVEIVGGPIVMPDNTRRLVICSDARALFTAWAAARLRYLARRHRPERADNELPGAFVTGKLDRIPWGSIEAERIVAGPGINPNALERAVRAAQRGPIIERMQ